jgi:RNA polymerase sigma-70 factor (ECF subfamily)
MSATSILHAVGRPVTSESATTTRDRYAELVVARLDRAYRLAGLILGNADAAEEAVGDAIERGWARLGQVRDPEAFAAWFDRILVNVCRDRLRRMSAVRFVAMTPTMDRPDPSDAFSTLLARDELLGALAALEPDERIVVVLHYWADLTLDEVAARLGARPGTVRSRLHRALERLRAHYAEAGTGVVR